MVNDAERAAAQQRAARGPGSGSPSDSTPVPVDAERIATLDFIRGVAVIGIVFANIAAFGQPFSAAFYPDAFLQRPDDWDRWAWLVQLVAIDGKLRGLFTLLFGAGLALFTDKAWAKGAGIGLQLRRLFWLLCFGAAHFALLWRGDILMSYALAGAVAVPFLRWSGRRLLTVGLAAYAVGALLLTGVYGFAAFAGRAEMAGHPQFGDAHAQMAAAQADATAKDAAEAVVIRAGDYGRYLANNIDQLPDQFGFSFLLTAFETLPLILLGMGLYRAGFFEGRIDRRRVLWWSIAGIAAGGAATLALGLREMREGLTYFGTIWTIMGVTMLPRLPMILGLAGLLTLADGRAAEWLGGRVRAAGRMAFTNYLATSFAMLWVFHGFGLGLFGELNRLPLYAVAAGMGALMLAWSKPSLDRFNYGPLEWLWRCLTYGRLFPLRRESGGTAPSVHKGE